MPSKYDKLLRHGFWRFPSTFEGFLALSFMAEARKALCPLGISNPAVDRDVCLREQSIVLAIGKPQGSDAMNDYPLIFKFKGVFQTPVFAAGITVEGHVLATKEEDGLWWLYGVNPGGMSQSGATLDLAYANFRTFFKGIVEDLAAEALSFEAFQAEVAKFIDDTDVSDSARWLKARAALKAGQAAEASFRKMTRVTGDSKPQLIDCTRLDQPKPAISLDRFVPAVKAGADEFDLAA